MLGPLGFELGNPGSSPPPPLVVAPCDFPTPLGFPFGPDRLGLCDFSRKASKVVAPSASPRPLPKSKDLRYRFASSFSSLRISPQPASESRFLAVRCIRFLSSLSYAVANAAFSATPRRMTILRCYSWAYRHPKYFQELHRTPVMGESCDIQIQSWRLAC